MGASQRVSRGFHRLAVFLAASATIIGIIATAFVALDKANSAEATHDKQVKLFCALTALKNAPALAQQPAATSELDPYLEEAKRRGLVPPARTASPTK
jgi:hypothetical protein